MKNNNKIKFFVVSDGDSSGDMRMDDEVFAFDSFEDARKKFADTLRDMGAYDNDDEDCSIERDVRELKEPAKCGVVYSWDYDNEDYCDSDSYAHVTYSLVKTDKYSTKTVYVLD